MARDKQPSSLPFLKSNLEASVLDADGNIDPNKIQAIEGALAQHKSEGGETNPSLVKVLGIAKGLLHPKDKK